MRWIVLAASISLAGCAGTEDLGKKFSTSVSAFASGVDSDISLELDLQQDFRRKSEGLEFISLGSYTCGYPSDPNTASVLHPKQSAAKVKKAAQDAINNKFNQIQIIVGYGQAMAAISKSGDDFEAGLTKMKTAASGLVGVVGGPEAAALNVAIGAVGSILSVGEGEWRLGQIYYAASKMQPRLVSMANDLESKKNVKLLSADEEVAYQMWNSCAQERLRFIRDRFFPVYQQWLTGGESAALASGKRYNGIDRSSVMEFANAYADYITEREKFLSSRPDYLSLIKAVVAANQAILDNNGPGVFFDTVGGLASTASTLNTASNNLRIASKKL